MDENKDIIKDTEKDEVITAKDEKEIKDEMKDIQKKVQKLLDMEKIGELIDSNVINFDYKDVKYRLSKPTFKQRQTVNEKRMEKYVELLKDSKNLMEQDLIVLYSKRGIDVEGMISKHDLLEKTKNDLLLKLGKAIKEGAPENELELLKTEIQDILAQQQEINFKKSVLLDTSIETQIQIFVYTYFGFILTQKQEGENWIQAWDSYDEYLNVDENLINKITFYTTFLVKAELPDVSL